MLNSISEYLWVCVNMSDFSLLCTFQKVLKGNYNLIKNRTFKMTSAFLDFVVLSRYTSKLSGMCFNFLFTPLFFFFQTKERYEKSLEELDKLTPQYMENMEQVFEQWQQFEDKRIRFFRELLLEVKQHLDLSTNHRSDTGQHKKKKLFTTGNT